LITDTLTCLRVLHGEMKFSSPSYKPAYVIFTALSIFGAVVSVLYRIRNARLLSAHVQEALQGASRNIGVRSVRQRQGQKYEWELVQTHRTLVVLSLNMMTVAVEGELVC
jgi:hypothetical protein